MVQCVLHFLGIRLSASLSSCPRLCEREREIGRVFVGWATGLGVQSGRICGHGEVMMRLMVLVRATRFVFVEKHFPPGMPRYAIFYGYLGTFLRGVPKQPSYSTDLESVEGVMEAALKRFPVANEPRFHYCSRTDQGVHAMRTCGHVDLVHSRENAEFKPEILHKGLNKFFYDALRPIRVHEVRRVCDEFSARHCAASRTYVYRFAVLRDSESQHAERDLKNLLPVTELDRCALVMPPFDAEKANQVADMFIGTKDFATFSKAPKRREQEHLHDAGIIKSTVRKVYECSLEPGLPLMVSRFQPRPQYDVWNLRVRASGFLYHMVRRMAGAVIAAGKGRLDLCDIEEMFDRRSSDAWNPRASTAEACGLYLEDVEYHPVSFETGQMPEKPWSRSQMRRDLADDACVKLRDSSFAG
ncbi:unnamed protein product [Notodromas monacha]|uniref:tRNA pseudouridine synthase n=1 Tax=Notodromas monacha TaxID=399045 RepID=A0A7R9BNC8_9CRUS|nr:unnamed protein product [Notodromas monacha]CAG0918657.1 unnamed protein product [Notodromas monacha]